MKVLVSASQVDLIFIFDLGARSVNACGTANAVWSGPGDCEVSGDVTIS